MEVFHLPTRPHLDQLKKQARELLAKIRSADPQALSAFERHHPARTSRAFALHDAQLVLARLYGFPSWPKLKEEVGRRTTGFATRAAKFVEDIIDNNLPRARRALDHDPSLAAANIWTSLVLGDIDAIRHRINRDPSFPHATGGPCKNWTPLLYVCFSRWQDSQTKLTECARLLLDAGADPNAAWEHDLWPGAPLRSLYGATGVNDNPPLARLLLERGAGPNDGESLPHAAQFDHRECVDILLAHGASMGVHPHWKNTPLYFLLGTSPTHGDWPLSRKGVLHLLERGSDPDLPCGDHADTALLMAIRSGHDSEIIASLIHAGADVNLANKNGATPITLAHRSGRPDIVALLRKHHARDIALSPKEQFFEAVFAGNQPAARALLDQDFTEYDRLALNRAAERGNLGAVATLLDLGFDIAFKGSQDWGSTPLHIAAWHGHADIVRFLIDRGAPLGIEANKPVGGPPLGWAAHGSANCRNPHGDYPSIVRMLIHAGAIVVPDHAEMASPDVADIIHATLAGKSL